MSAVHYAEVEQHVAGSVDGAADHLHADSTYACGRNARRQYSVYEDPLGEKMFISKRAVQPHRIPRVIVTLGRRIVYRQLAARVR